MKGYLAGPIHGCTDEEAKGWRNKIKAAVPNIEWIDPMDRDFRGNEHFNAAKIVEGDKKDIDCCDFIVANIWKDCVGTLMELIYAYEVARISAFVIYPGKNMSPWIEYHSDVRRLSVEELIKFLFVEADSALLKAYVSGKELDWS